MKTKLEKKVNFLTGYAIVSSLVFSVVILSSFGKEDKKETFDEITTKKINLIGEDGSLRMVLSNETRQHSGRMNGKDYPKRERPAGMIFFNDEGDECGGLIFAGKTKDNKTSSGMSFTMDNYHDDQVIQLLNTEEYENGKSFIQRGLTINEFPLGSNIDTRNAKFEELEKIENKELRNQKMDELWAKEGSKRRLFIGRNKSNSSGLFLYDKEGNPKIKIHVDEEGNPKIEIVDKNGKTRNFLESK
ncbi:hypothetical protein [Flavobacterium sp. K5-23]|uniref:hypothetical protein n=1 Tax=Flavobacterium sp. K5-23 TaxID=2746225 RepID=UPI00200FEF6A|nr:hypothetical protein [Flavobacterium sp. K5-23]UQD57578.1 hypothetical protein FLAK523_14760 [Flavobacterium sp. K5-23]